MGKEGKFKWFWQEPDSLALWEKFHKMTPQELAKVDDNIKHALTQKYGNIYWFRPSPGQKPFLESGLVEKFLHGNNSSGKSYTAAADLSYEAIGWSPYRDILPSKYSEKRLWAFSKTFDLQRSSSQVHLFSTDSPNDVGLLPAFSTIEKYGGKVSWNKNSCLNYVKLPTGEVLEFKSAEQQALNLQAAAVDVVWFDEFPPEGTFDEVTARLIRKGGRMVMSFIVEDPDHYIIKGRYRDWEADKEVEGIRVRDISDFHFIGIDDNPSLDEYEKKLAKARLNSGDAVWRFTEGGKFNLVPTGHIVYSDASEDHFFEDLRDQYDPMRTLFRSWDLGFNHPAVVAFQLDKNNRRKYLFSIMGEDVLLTDFIDEVEAYTKHNLPDIRSKYEILPHDAKRQYDTAPQRAFEIFEEKGLERYDIVYTRRDASLENVALSLRENKYKQPMIQIDQQHADLLCKCLLFYTRDSEGIPKRDRYYEHVSDAFKQAEYWIKKGGKVDVLKEFKTPSYHQQVIYGGDQVPQIRRVVH